MDQKHISQIVHHISYHPSKRLEEFLSYPTKEQIEIFNQLTVGIKKSILSKIDDESLIKIIEFTDPNTASSILKLLPPKVQDRVVSKLNVDIKNIISKLLKFDPDTAVSLMDMNYVLVSTTESKKDVVEKIKEHEVRTSRTPTVLVLHNGKLFGFIPTHLLAVSNQGSNVKELAHKIVSLKYTTKHKQILETFKTAEHGKVVVLGEDEEVLGVIYSDKILSLLQRQKASSLYNFAGVKDTESVYDSVINKVRSRYKWLIINLATAFFASTIVGMFNDTISRNILLAVYMPIVAGMGGNSATQTLAVMVRGIALNQINLHNMWRTLRNEVVSGFVNGLINGVLVALVVFYINHDLLISVVLGVAMVTNLVVASTFGTIIPLIMTALKKDPASSATIFITTATDVLGFLVFLGLASVLLS